jgi:hypothetical protein
VSTRNAAPSLVDANRSVGLSALRGVEVAELLRVVTTLHLEGLLSDDEYRAKRQRLIALH